MKEIFLGVTLQILCVSKYIPLPLTFTQMEAHSSQQVLILGPQESPVPSLGLFNLSMFSTGLKIHPLVPPGMITVQQEADQQVKFSHSITQLQFSSSSQGGHPEDET